MANQKLYRVRGVPIAYPVKVQGYRGGEQDLTEERLRGIAERYDPTDPLKHEARVIIGHPDDTTAPSFGFVEAARYEDGYLKADYAGLSESAVRDIQRTGRFPRRSMELIKLNGEDYLGDSAQLGAKRPAIKGLPHINPSQIEEMSAAECAAFSERLGSDESTGLLFSEEPESPEEKPNMAEDNVQLAERAATAEAALAEAQKREAEKDAKLAEYAERDAARVQELKFSEATSEALKFAEGTDIKPKLGAVETGHVAKLLAHARLNCPDIDGLNFGEALEAFIGELPNVAPPTGNLKLGEVEKPSDIKFSERVQAGLDEIKDKHGEDSKQYKAAFAAAEKATLQLAEGAK